MQNSLRELYSTESFRAAGHRIVDLLADHLEANNSGQVDPMPWQEPADALGTWAKLAGGNPSVEAYCEALLAGSVRPSNPRYMGHQVCYPAPTAMLAGLMVDCLNNGSGVYEMGMAGTSMEKLLIESLAARFGFGGEAGGFLTSGGTLANLTALLSAQARAQAADPEDQRPMTLLVSSEAHYSVKRAVQVMGWGKAGIECVPVDDRYKMRFDKLPELAEAIERSGRRLVAVVGSGCTTSTGSFDPLEPIADFCQERNAWFHVDAAHGGAVAYSDRHRHLLNGIGRADSVTVDFHKMLLTPALCSGLVFRTERDSYRTFEARADYLFSRQNDEAQEPPDRDNLARRTFECTKTMMAAKAFSVLAVHGECAWRESVDHLQELTQQFARLIVERERFELAVQPETNIICYRYRQAGQSDAAVSHEMQLLRERLKQAGEFYIVTTILDGQVWLRSTISNPFTQRSHMVSLLDAIEAA